ncbi:MAG: tetratricopeptide repeat protein [Spirochaetales bacterium]|nr:tetratricopeptide repeat protein [Spirochaetales bacterium]
MALILNPGDGPQQHLRLRVAVIAALAVFTAAAYAPLIGAGWVYDDVNLVKPSPALKDLSGLCRSISTDLYSQAAPRLEMSPYWRPLAMASFWLDTRFGEAPGALHVGNILLHALATALLAFVILRRHGGIAGIAAAATAAAWWAFHPQNVEPVAWISCRYDLLCGVALLGLLALPWRPGPFRASLYGLIFLAGLLSKEGFGAMAVVVVAMDFADHRTARDAAPRWVAVAIALAVWVALRAAVGIRSFDLPPPEAVLRILLNFPEAITVYIGRAIVPQPLTISHPYTSGGVFGVAAGAAIFAAFIAAAILWRRQAPSSGTGSRRRNHAGTEAGTAAAVKRPLAVPAAIFLAWFVPVAGAMAMFHEVGERYLYVPSIGLALIVAELVVLAVSARRRIVRVIVPAALGIVIIFGIVRVEQRLPDWKNDDTLWTAAFRVNPLDPLANHYRAISTGRRGDWNEAQRAIEIASRGDPGSGRFATTYAWVLLGKGDAAGAVREAERATILAPYQPDGWYYLAFARHKIGDHEGELAALEKLLEIAPDYPGARRMREIAACEVSGREDCPDTR